MAGPLTARTSGVVLLRSLRVDDDCIWGQMKSLEWWYEVDPGCLAHTALLQDSFTTRVAGRDALVYPPGVPAGAISWANAPLGPPQIAGYTASSPPGEQWGWLDSFTADNEEIVAVKRLVLTSQFDPDVEDAQVVAEQVVEATASWWAAVSAWVELITGQHLTHVGHYKPQVLGNVTPIWLIGEDGFSSTSMKIRTTSRIELSPLNLVDSSIFRNVLFLAEPGPPLAWTLLRGARSLKNVGQHRRAVIDAATAADLGVTQLLDEQLQIHNPTERAATLQKNPMLGQKVKQLSKLGVPLPQSFNDKLVCKRNVAVHEGAIITNQQCSDAIGEAVSVVEKAFPLPKLPTTAQSLKRLW